MPYSQGAGLQDNIDGDDYPSEEDDYDDEQGTSKELPDLDGADGGELNSDLKRLGLGGAGSHATHHPVSVITDEEANEIYLRMATQSQARKGFIKKNWAEEETKLLKWAVITYTRQKNITYSSLVTCRYLKL